MTRLWFVLILAIIMAGCAADARALLGFSKASCSDDSDCRSKEFCETKDCGTESGVCIKIPKKCGWLDGMLSKPECGCDGTTYENRCERRLAQTSLAGAGACVPASGCEEMCNGKNRKTCRQDCASDDSVACNAQNNNMPCGQHKRCADGSCIDEAYFAEPTRLSNYGLAWPGPDQDINIVTAQHYCEEMGYSRYTSYHRCGPVNGFLYWWYSEGRRWTGERGNRMYSLFLLLSIGIQSCSLLNRMSSSLGVQANISIFIHVPSA